MADGWKSAFSECLQQEGARIHRRMVAATAAAELDEAGPVEAAQPQDRVPLSPANWIENEYFAGPLTRRMWPRLKAIFIDICDRHIFEVVCGGAIGWGKSTLARALHLRSKYLLSCPARPHEAFARPLIETSPIVFLNMNVTADKAYTAYFSEFTALVDAVPYFREQFPRKPGLLHRLKFPRMIESGYAGASKTAAESENMIFCFLDEANLYDVVERSKRSEEGGRYDEARIVHGAARFRMMSRFMNPNDGSYPEACKLVTMCKETYKDSFVRRRIREIRAEGLDRDQVGPDGAVTRRASAVVLEYANWELWEPELHRKHFWIVTGTRQQPARIVVDKRRAHDARQDAEEMRTAGKPPDEIPEVIAVPEAGGEMKRAAEEDIDLFLRDMCGKPTDAINRFIQDRAILFSSVVTESGAVNPGFDPGWSGGYVHPFTDETTDMQTDGVALVETALAVQVRQLDPLTRQEYMVWRPIRAPEAPRFIHLDMGLSSDNAGLAMVCPGAMKEVFDPDAAARARAAGFENVGETTTLRPMSWVDLVLKIRPPRNGQIPFSRIVLLVRRLRELGFRIARVTADGYQSAMFLQAMGELGIDNAVLSMDRTPEPYLALRTAMREGRLALYEYAPLVKELAELETINSRRVTNGKAVYTERVDHPPKGSKDAADAVAGAVWGVEMEHTRYGAPMSFAQGQRRSDALAVQHAAGVQARQDFKEGRWDRLFNPEGET